MSDARASSPGFDTESDHILSFLLLLIQEGQLSITWKDYVHEALVNCLGGLSLPRKSVVRLNDCPDMNIDDYRGHKNHHHNNNTSSLIWYLWRTTDEKFIFENWLS